MTLNCSLLEVINATHTTEASVAGYDTAKAQLEDAIQLAGVSQYYSSYGITSITANLATEMAFDSPALPGAGKPSDMMFTFLALGQGDNVGREATIRHKIPGYVDRKASTGRSIFEAYAETAEALKPILRQLS